MATLAATYALQTLGYPAVAEGNVIVVIDDLRMGVEDACNGLGMLDGVLRALSTAVALVIQRPLYEKIIDLLLQRDSDWHPREPDPHHRDGLKSHMTFGQAASPTPCFTATRGWLRHDAAGLC